MSESSEKLKNKNETVEIIVLINKRDLKFLAELLPAEAFFYQKLIYWVLKNAEKPEYLYKKIVKFYWNEGWLMIELEDGTRLRI